MNLEDRLQLIRSVGEEIVTEEELRALLEAKANPIAYDGFEPSGNIHIAQGILRAINVNKMTKAGCRFKMFVADWHAWANNKLGGDLEKIQTTGHYLMEVWKATGMDLENVDFVWASEFVTDEEYWKKVMNIARDASLDRVLRTTQIMGRSEKDKLSAAQILYPCMQAADIFHLKADITQLGMDQRKVNMLAREVGPKLGFWKPVVVSHHMLMGLAQPPPPDAPAEERALAMKMSKSNPGNAIFMTDTAQDVEAKLKKAYCPEKQVEDNPVLEWNRYMIFERFPVVRVERPEKFGGTVEFHSYAELEASYREGKLHPMDLKKTTGMYINQMLDPVRKHFETNDRARELLAQVKSFQVTR
ncbi:MAG TPA: tyrosine--tRNA ligase [Candidatus Thermoplasmatota archaeon]|nr:tyrosine--tRNA ligase [Candidatus Thermoplasmatota archaeon]